MKWLEKDLPSLERSQTRAAGSFFLSRIPSPSSQQPVDARQGSTYAQRGWAGLEEGVAQSLQ